MLEASGAQAELNTQKRGAKLPPSSAPYCEYKDDRERRHALVSRDLRIVGCRIVTVAGAVTLALFTPTASLVGFFVRLMGRVF